MRVINRLIGSRLRGAVVLCASALLLSATSSPDSPVADAAQRGDHAAVRALLQQGADVNAAQGDGMTALHWAAARGDVELVKMLTYAGARLEAVTRNGRYTPLHLAARAGRTSVVDALLESGANVHAITTSGGTTALHFAAAQGDAVSIQAFLKRGADVNARETAFGQTPLMWAAAADRVAAIGALLEGGANIDAASKVEDIPERDRADRADAQRRNRRVAALRAADQPQQPAGRGQAAAAQGQRGGGRGEGGRGGGRGGEGGQRGAAPARAAQQASQAADSSRAAATDSTRRQTPDSVRTTTADSARTTTADSMRTGAADSVRSTPARAGAAASRNNAESASAGADARRGAEPDSTRRDPEARSLSYAELVGGKGGLTPLLFAAREGNTESVRVLLDAGAAIDQVSGGDHTSPLLMATLNGHFDLATMLIERGADVKLASDAGATPLYAALNVQWSAKSLYPQPTAHKQQQTTYLELMEALLQKGADPNVRLTKHLWYMSYNFDLLGVNTTGATPFWRAAYGTDVDAMRLLVKYGADHTIPTIKPTGRMRGDDAPAEDDDTRTDPSGLPPIPNGGPGVYPIHAASGVGYGEGYAANAHRHAPDGWLPAVKYLVEELGHDVNARDHNGYNPVHHAAARGHNELIQYLVEKGADVTAVSRRGQTTADMANGPVQRVSPFPETVALLEKLGSKNNHRCRSC